MCNIVLNCFKYCFKLVCLFRDKSDEDDGQDWGTYHQVISLTRFYAILCGILWKIEKRETLHRLQIRKINKMHTQNASVITSPCHYAVMDYTFKKANSLLQSTDIKDTQEKHNFDKGFF